MLVARCAQYNFSDLREKIGELIQKIESILVEQKLTTQDVNFLCPVIDESSIQKIVSVNFSELDRLKELKHKLSRSNHSKGAKGYLTKRAYFELFFIGELLGLHAVPKAGEKNDLLTFVEIITKQTKSKRAKLSGQYQKYALFKKLNSEIHKLIFEGKRRYVDNSQFSSVLEKFQTDIYFNIPVSSSK